MGSTIFSSTSLSDSSRILHRWYPAGACEHASAVRRWTGGSQPYDDKTNLTLRRRWCGIERKKPRTFVRGFGKIPSNRYYSIYLACASFCGFCLFYRDLGSKRQRDLELLEFRQPSARRN